MKIAVLTSGGDAPGMNAAVRAVARMAFARHRRAVGIESGYRGLLEGQFQPLSNRMVGEFCNGAGPCWELPVRRSLRLPKVKNLRSRD